MTKTLRASVIVLALCVPAFAGDMLTPSVVPTPQPATTVQGPTTDGDISTGVTAPTADGIMQNEAAATFAQVLLNLLALS